MTEPDAQAREPEPVAESIAMQAPTADTTDGRIDTAQLLLLGRPDDAELAAAREDQPPVSYAGIAVLLGIVGLIGTLFVMWMVPFSIGAIVFAEVSRRNGHTEWPTKLAYATGVVGVIFGGVWLVSTLGLLL